MEFDKIIESLSSNIPDINDGSLFAKIYTTISQRRKKALSKNTDELKRICCEEYDQLSRRLDRSKLQDSPSVRNILKIRRLSNLLINDKGEIDQIVLDKTIKQFTENLYSLGPDRQHDSVRQNYILNTLKLIKNDKDVDRLFKNIGKPYSNPVADQLIIETLQLPSKTIVTDAHAKRAALTALLSYLRQNVGSCFSTAPCIVVHNEQPVQFLTDLNELLSTGRLKRVWAGIEYSVPLSPSWGSGDLKRVLPYIENDISYSPGLMAAFEEAKLINVEDSLTEKIQHIKDILKKVFGDDRTRKFIFITPEEIIRKVLLQHLDITERDLKDFLNRPQGMIQNSLMLQAPQSSISMGGKGQVCSNFLILFDQAKNAFKAIADNALLKAWEFTIACFAENKAGFTKWNLYSSLGFGVNENGGIGQGLYKIINRKLEEVNLKLKNLQDEYEQIYAQIQYMESRIKHASEREAPWLRAEYQSKRNEFYTFQELKDRTHSKASRYANLFNILVQKYDQLFPVYFQEVYDADMHDVNSGPYDDSPAGFRLLYKFGRSHTSSWQRIYTPNQFVDALSSFFSMTENEIANSDELVGMEHDLSEIVTGIISHIKTREFLETAFYRIASAHHSRLVKDPLNNLDLIEKKPWSYTSGGSMDTLVTTYFRRDIKPFEVGRWIENPMELNVFLVDIMKQAPKNIRSLIESNPQKNLLMQSPTHAFNFNPGFPSFEELWKEDAFTYTWVRDNILKPREDFVEHVDLTDDAIEFLVEHLAQYVPDNHKHFFRRSFSNLYGPMKPFQFREKLMEGLRKELGLKSEGRAVLSSDLIDGTLFSLLPIFPINQLQEKVEAIFSEIKSKIKIDKRLVQVAIDAIIKGSVGNKVITAPTLQNICKALICIFIDNTCSPIDFHKEVSLAAQKLRLAMPLPILFADTNWVRDYFAFMINPGNQRWELWRVDCLGSQGFPMTIWEQWLNGSQRQSKWGVYINPYEYTF